MTDPRHLADPETIAETPPVESVPDAEALRSRLRTDLVAAIKARDSETVTLLRTTIAAIDNAEAVAAKHGTAGTSQHVAGARHGVGSTESARRELTTADVQAVLHEQIAERIAAVDRYDSHGQGDAAARLRREADLLRRYLRDDQSGGPDDQ